MKLIFIIIAISLSYHCQAQEFTVTDSSDIVTINIPKTLKAYTYNHFKLTDSSLIITTPKKKLDVIIRDPNKEKNMFLFFPETTPNIKGKNYYDVKTGEPVIFTVRADDSYLLTSNKLIAFHFIVDEYGNLQELTNIPEGKQFQLSPDRIYGFKYIPQRIGNTTLEVNLSLNNQKIETKEFPIFTSPCPIQLKAEAKIEDSGYNIKYKVLSTSPIPDNLVFSLCLKIEINGFYSTIRTGDITFIKGKTEYNGVFRQSIRGRYPKSYSVIGTDLEIISVEDNVNYKYNISNL